MRPRFGLTLAVTGDCNLRCSYCYAGAKSPRVMPEELGRLAIDRAAASVAPGGRLELGFFGGEPLLESALVLRLAAHARERARRSGVELSVGLTTNGTLSGGAAWELLMLPGLDLTLSLDGPPEVHDRHRRFADGRGSFAAVLSTLRWLRAARREFSAAAVVRPDSLDGLPGALRFLRDEGAARVVLSLDVWADWAPEDLPRLELAVAGCADVWAESPRYFGVAWFDDKAALLAGAGEPVEERCGFGDWELAVAPSGRLYPCERLVAGDRPDNPARLPGLVTDGTAEAPFLPRRFAGRSASACGGCTAGRLCAATCRCNNLVRTGDVSRPDRLLCSLEKACLRETLRSLGRMQLSAAPAV